MSKPKIPLPTEHAEQVAVCQWWESYCGTRKLHANLLFAIPNAQKFMSKARNMHAAYAHAKAEGLREGTPDLMLAGPKFRKGAKLPPMKGDSPYIPIHFIDVEFCGLFIEMKRKGEKARPEQIAFADMLRRQGYSVVIAQGADEAIRAICGYLES